MMSKVAISRLRPKALPVAQLRELIDEHGAEKAWKSILKTHAKSVSPSDFGSIYDSTELQDGVYLDQDFLAGLTVGSISVLYEFSLAYANRASRKDEGQYFTPDDVAEFLASKSSDFPQGIWLDPCSGVGNLIFRIVSKQADPESFLLGHAYLVDKDALALLIARVLLTMEFQKTNKNLYEDISKQFLVRDYLDDAPLPEFDFAILNPPYVLVPQDDRFESVKCRDLFGYFVEKTAKLSKGFISITPQSFTNGGKFEGLRKVLIREVSQADIYCFDNVPGNVFEGVKFGSTNSNKVNSTRAGVIVARKDEKAKNQYRITPLLRWRTTEREELLKKADSFLTVFKPTSEDFPKIDQESSSFFEARKALPRTLGTYVSTYATEYVLYLGTTPRYFISAVETPLERSSMRKVYFHTELERDYFYMLLNTSYLYWWWRVNDGGMTLSEKTLMSLPVDAPTKLNASLLAELRKSEKTNVVYKKNGGIDSQNIKHPLSLVEEWTKSFFPKDYRGLVKSHRNSVFATE